MRGIILSSVYLFYLSFIFTTKIVPHDKTTNKNSNHCSTFEQEAQYLGTEEADAWRIDLIKQVLEQLGKKNYQNVSVKKLSLQAHKELQVNGCATSHGIWLLHNQGMNNALSYYIAVHEAVHYAFNHSYKRSVATHLAEQSSNIGTVLGIIGAAFASRSPKNSLNFIVACASCASIFCNNFFSYHAKKLLTYYVNELEKEADHIAAQLIEKNNRADVLSYLVDQDRKRHIMRPTLDRKVATYQVNLYRKHSIDPIWTAHWHIQNINNYVNSKQKDSY